LSSGRGPRVKINFNRLRSQNAKRKATRKIQKRKEDEKQK
jgi:hypothetical protein